MKSLEGKILWIYQNLLLNFEPVHRNHQYLPKLQKLHSSFFSPTFYKQCVLNLASPRDLISNIKKKSLPNYLARLKWELQKYQSTPHMHVHKWKSSCFVDFSLKISSGTGELWVNKEGLFVIMSKQFFFFFVLIHSARIFHIKKIHAHSWILDE